LTGRWPAEATLLVSVSRLRGKKRATCARSADRDLIHAARGPAPAGYSPSGQGLRPWIALARQFWCRGQAHHDNLRGDEGVQPPPLGGPRLCPCQFATVAGRIDKWLALRAPPLQ